MKVNTRRTLRLNKLIIVSLFFTGSILGQVVLQDAMRAFQNGNYSESAILLEGYCNDFPYDISAFQYLVNSYLQMKDNEKAISLLEDGVEKFANNDELKLVLAKLYLNKMELVKAEKILLDLSNRNFQKVEVDNLLGKAYYNKAVLQTQNKKYYNALENITKAKKLGITNVELYGLEAQVLMKLKRSKKAEKVINAGLKLYPNEKMLLTTKAILLIEQKKYKDAIDIFTPIWEADQSNLEVGLQLAILYRANHKIKEAFEIYDSLLKTYPKERAVYDAMIDYLKLTRKNEDLRNLYKSMKKEFPQSIDMDYEIAQTYVAEKNDSAAIAKLTDFIEDNGNSEKISIQLSELYLNINQKDEAISILKKAIDEKLYSESIFLQLGEIYKSSDDFEFAEETYKEQNIVYPKSYLPYLELGKLYKSKKDYKTASNYFKQGLDISGSNPILLFELSQTLDIIDSEENAILSYQNTFKSAVASLEEEQKFVKTKIATTSNIIELENDKDLAGNKIDLLKSITDRSFKFLLQRLTETEMQSLLNPILNKFSQSAILLYYQGEVYFKSNKLKNSEKYYTRALNTNSKFEEAHFRLAEIYLKQNKNKKAKLSYKRVLGINPKSSKAYKQLIYLYREEGKLSSLCDEWLNIFSTQPENKLLEEYLIIALHKAGRIEEAKEIINKSE